MVEDRSGPNSHGPSPFPEKGSENSLSVPNSSRLGPSDCEHSGEPPEPAPGRKHPQVVAAVITFCIGLMVVRFVLGLLYPSRMNLAAGSDDPLLELKWITIVCSLFYLILREAEGDFRSLFIIATVLFVGEEALTYTANQYWIGSFHSRSLLVTIAACIFSSIALISAVYDPPSPDRYRTQMLVSCLVILLVSTFRALGTLPLPPFDQYHNALGIVVLAIAMIYMAGCLLRPDKRSGDITPVRGPATGPSVALEKRDGGPYPSA